jgi:hypothetical protein
MPSVHDAVLWLRDHPPSTDDEQDQLDQIKEELANEVDESHHTDNNNNDDGHDDATTAPDELDHDSNNNNSDVQHEHERGVEDVHTTTSSTS